MYKNVTIELNLLLITKTIKYIKNKRKKNSPLKKRMNKFNPNNPNV